MMLDSLTQQEIDLEDDDILSAIEQLEHQATGCNTASHPMQHQENDSMMEQQHQNSLPVPDLQQQNPSTENSASVQEQWNQSTTYPQHDPSRNATTIEQQPSNSPYPPPQQDYNFSNHQQPNEESTSVAENFVAQQQQLESIGVGTSVSVSTVSTNTIAPSLVHTSMNTESSPQKSTVSVSVCTSNSSTDTKSVQTDNHYSAVEVPSVTADTKDPFKKSCGLLTNIYGIRAFQRGTLYYRDEHVFDLEEDVEYEDDDCEIVRLTSKCWGSVIEHYCQDILLQRGADGLIHEISSDTCTCPVPSHCKHCVAALLQYLHCKKEAPTKKISAPKSLGQEYARLLKESEQRKECSDAATNTSCPLTVTTTSRDEKASRDTPSPQQEKAIQNTPQIDRSVQDVLLTTPLDKTLASEQKNATKSSNRTPQRSVLHTSKPTPLSFTAGKQKCLEGDSSAHSATLLSTPSPKKASSGAQKTNSSAAPKIRLTQEDFSYGESRCSDEEDSESRISDEDILLSGRYSSKKRKLLDSPQFSVRKRRKV